MISDSIQLILPDIRYKTEYIDALKEFRQENDLFFSRKQLYQSYDLHDLDHDFDRIILQPFRDSAAGIDLPEGFVPQSEYWMVQNNEYIGAIHIRHGLTPFLETEGGNLGYEIRPSKRGHGYAKLAAQMGLHKAAELGLNRVIITCNAMNTPSVHVALHAASHNTGHELEPYTTENGRVIRRFDFSLAKPDHF